MKHYLCEVCGDIYDEAKGDPESCIPPRHPHRDYPEEWVSPECGATRASFLSVG